MPLGASRFGLSGADLGKLELLSTQSVSNTATVDFTSIDTSYNVHFFTFNNLQREDSTGFADMRIQFYESGVLETASVYQYAQQYGGTGGAFGELKSTGDSGIDITADTASADISNGYIYLYNAGDSSKYTFTTNQNWWQVGATGYMFFASGVLPQTSTVDGVRFLLKNSKTFNATTTGTISLYGIKE
tara:strand:+ start:133 stop:696 length:564 start_codon:yes stop_codon:yes gene_type:complete